MASGAPPLVETKTALRVTYPSERGSLSEILRALHKAGGRLYGHFVEHRPEEPSVGVFVYDRPDEVIGPMREAGLEVEARSVLVVRTEDDDETFRRILSALEGAGISVGLSYAILTPDGLVVVVATDDDERAEVVLRDSLSRLGDSNDDEPDAERTAKRR